jgi:hypothetical protein
MSEIHVRIACANGDFPTDDELGQRQALAEAIAERDLGEVVDTAATDGAMDVYVEVEDVTRATAGIAAIAEEMGLGARTQIEGAP